MADQLKKKKKTRAGHRAYMTNIQPKVRTCIESFDEDVKPRVIVLKTSLEEQLATLTELDKEILELLEEKEDAVEDEELENKIKESCNVRGEIRTNITMMNVLLVPTPQPAESCGRTTERNSTPQRSVRAKLPKLEVKKFSGKIHDWQEFWDNYERQQRQQEPLRCGEVLLPERTHRRTGKISHRRVCPDSC